MANTIEPLRAANTLSRRALYTWSYVTLTGAAAVSSSGLRVMPDLALSQAQGDFLMVMPSYRYQDFTGPEVVRGLRSAATRFGTVVGLDTGSWLLAGAGLLNGRRATIHWDELTAMAEQFPNVTVLRERYVIEDDVITCSGAMAAFDLVLHLIGRHHGPGLGLSVEQLFMSRDIGSAPEAMSVIRGRLSRRAAALMQEHLEHPISLRDVAGRLRCSQKRLEQTVRRDLGVTPQRLYLQLRLTLAWRLAETTQVPLSEVALRCGYQTQSALSRAFRAHFGETPSQVRCRGD